MGCKIKYKGNDFDTLVDLYEAHPDLKTKHQSMLFRSFNIRDESNTVAKKPVDKVLKTKVQQIDAEKSISFAANGLGISTEIGSKSKIGNKLVDFSNPFGTSENSVEKVNTTKEANEAFNDLMNSDVYDNNKELLSRKEALQEVIDDGSAIGIRIMTSKDDAYAKSLDLLINGSGGSMDTKSTSKSDYRNHSGGAKGADSLWDSIGKSQGFHKHNHYFHKSKDSLPNANYSLSESVMLEGYNRATDAARAMYSFVGEISNEKIARNWAQVENAGTIYAIAPLRKRGDPISTTNTNLAKRDQVQGGTGYAVEMAIQAKKPVYVFDQGQTNKWYLWDPVRSTFVETSTPVLTKDYAGIGSRNMTKEGKAAIADVFKKTEDNISNSDNSARIEAYNNSAYNTYSEINKVTNEQANSLVDIVDSVNRNIAERLGITVDEYQIRVRSKVIDGLTVDSIRAELGRPSDSAVFDFDKDADILFQSKEQIESKFKSHPKFTKVKGVTADDHWLLKAMSRSDIVDKARKLHTFKDKEAIREEIKTRMDSLISNLVDNVDDYLFKGYSEHYPVARFTDAVEKNNVEHMQHWSKIINDPSYSNRNTKVIANEQKGIIESNLSYLDGNSDYSIEFRYLALLDMIESNYILDKKGGIKRKAIKSNSFSSTEGGIVDYSPASIKEVYENHSDKGTHYVGMSYTYVIEHSNKEKDKFLETYGDYIDIEMKFDSDKEYDGYWLKFTDKKDKVSDIDTQAELLKDIAASNWCTAGATSTALYQIKAGDFYVFVNSKTLKSTVAVHYINDEIDGVFGTASSQNLTIKDSHILDDIGDNFLNGEAYKKDKEIQQLIIAERDGKIDFNDIDHRDLSLILDSSHHVGGSQVFDELHFKAKEKALKIVSKVLSNAKEYIEETGEFKIYNILDYKDIINSMFNANNVLTTPLSPENVRLYEMILSGSHFPLASFKSEQILDLFPALDHTAASSNSDIPSNSPFLEYLLLNSKYSNQRDEFLKDSEEFFPGSIETIENYNRTGVLGKEYRIMHNESLMSSQLFIIGSFRDGATSKAIDVLKNLLPFYGDQILPELKTIISFYNYISSINIDKDASMRDDIEFASGSYYDKVINFKGISDLGKVDLIRNVIGNSSPYYTILDKNESNKYGNESFIYGISKRYDPDVHSSIVNYAAPFDEMYDMSTVIKDIKSDVTVYGALSLKGNSSFNHKITIKELPTSSFYKESTKPVVSLGYGDFNLKDIKLEGDGLFVTNGANLSMNADMDISEFSSSDSVVKINGNVKIDDLKLNNSTFNANSLKSIGDVNSYRSNINIKGKMEANKFKFSFSEIKANKFELSSLSGSNSSLISNLLLKIYHNEANSSSFTSNESINLSKMNIESVKNTYTAPKVSIFKLDYTFDENTYDTDNLYLRSLDMMDHPNSTKDLLGYKFESIDVDQSIVLKNFEAEKITVESDIFAEQKTVSLDLRESNDNTPTVITTKGSNFVRAYHAENALFISNHNGYIQHYGGIRISSYGNKEHETRDANDQKAPKGKIIDDLLFQNESNPKGAITKSADKKRYKIFFDKQTADVTTVIHEKAHEYEDVLTPEEISVIESWSGHKSGTVEFSEAFAKGAEKYIYEGNVPDGRVGKVLSKFVDWFKAAIKDAKAYFSDLNDFNDATKEIYKTMFVGPSSSIRNVPISSGSKVGYNGKEYVTFGKEKNGKVKMLDENGNIHRESVDPNDLELFDQSDSKAYGGHQYTKIGEKVISLTSGKTITNPRILAKFEDQSSPNEFDTDEFEFGDLFSTLVDEKIENEDGIFGLFKKGKEYKNISSTTGFKGKTELLRKFNIKKNSQGEYYLALNSVQTARALRYIKRSRGAKLGNTKGGYEIQGGKKEVGTYEENLKGNVTYKVINGKGYLFIEDKSEVIVEKDGVKIPRSYIKESYRVAIDLVASTSLADYLAGKKADKKGKAKDRIPNDLLEDELLQAIKVRNKNVSSKKAASTYIVRTKKMISNAITRHISKHISYSDLGNITPEMKAKILAGLRKEVDRIVAKYKAEINKMPIDELKKDLLISYSVSRENNLKHTHAYRVGDTKLIEKMREDEAADNASFEKLLNGLPIGLLKLVSIDFINVNGAHFSTYSNREDGMNLSPMKDIRSHSAMIAAMSVNIALSDLTKRGIVTDEDVRKINIHLVANYLLSYKKVVAAASTYGGDPSFLTYIRSKYLKKLSTIVKNLDQEQVKSLFDAIEAATLDTQDIISKNAPEVLDIINTLYTEGLIPSNSILSEVSISPKNTGPQVFAHEMGHALDKYLHTSNPAAAKSMSDMSDHLIASPEFEKYLVGGLHSRGYDNEDIQEIVADINATLLASVSGVSFSGTHLAHMEDFLRDHPDVFIRAYKFGFGRDLLPEEFIKTNDKVQLADLVLNTFANRMRKFFNQMIESLNKRLGTSFDALPLDVKKGDIVNKTTVTHRKHNITDVIDAMNQTIMNEENFDVETLLTSNVPTVNFVKQRLEKDFDDVDDSGFSSKFDDHVDDAINTLESLTMTEDSQHKEFIEELKAFASKKKWLSSLNRKKKENEVVQSMGDVLANAAAQKRMTKELDMDFAMKQSAVYSDKHPNGVDFLSSTSQRGLLINNRVALDSVSIMARSYTFHSTMQSVGGISVPNTIYIDGFDHNEKLGLVGNLKRKASIIPQSIHKDFVTRNIADDIEEFLNVAVDNGTVQAIAGFGLDIDIVANMSTLMETGFGKMALNITKKEYDNHKDDDNDFYQERDGKYYFITSLPFLYGKSMGKFKSDLSDIDLLEQIGEIKAKRKRKHYPFKPENFYDIIINGKIPTLNDLISLAFLDDSLSKLSFDVDVLRVPVDVTSKKAMGTSLFDKMLKFNKLVARINNADKQELARIKKVFGPIAIFSNSDNSSIHAHKSDGYLVLGTNEGNTILVKPDNYFSSAAINSFIASNEVFNDFVPYSNEQFQLMFIELDPHSSTKASTPILRAYKDFMISDQNSALFSKESINDARKRLHGKSSPDDNYFAQYINGIMNVNHSVSDEVSQNPFLKDILLSVDTGQSQLKMANNQLSSLATKERQFSLYQLYSYPHKLPDFNGRPYNTRDLIADLIRYDIVGNTFGKSGSVTKNILPNLLEDFGVNDSLRTGNVTKNSSISAQDNLHHNLHQFRVQYISKNISDFEIDKGFVKISTPSSLLLKKKGLKTFVVFDGLIYKREVGKPKSYHLFDSVRDENPFYSTGNQTSFDWTDTTFDIDPLASKLTPGMDGLTMLEYAISADTNPAIHRIKLINMLKNSPGIRLVIKEDMDSNNPASYNYLPDRENQILNVNADFYNNNRDATQLAVIKELVHHVSVSKINDHFEVSSKATGRKVKPKANASDSARKLFEVYKNTKEALLNYDGTDPDVLDLSRELKRMKANDLFDSPHALAHGMSNIFEFVSEVLVDPKLRSVLAKVKYGTGKTSSFDKAIEIIRKMVSNFFNLNLASTEAILEFLHDPNIDKLNDNTTPSQDNYFQEEFYTIFRSSKDFKKSVKDLSDDFGPNKNEVGNQKTDQHVIFDVASQVKVMDNAHEKCKNK